MRHRWNANFIRNAEMHNYVSINFIQNKNIDIEESYMVRLTGNFTCTLHVLSSKMFLRVNEL